MAKRNNVKTKKIKKENVIDESLEIKRFIKIVIILVIVFGVVYGFTVLLNNRGVFNKDIERISPAEAVIDYENILLGSTFDLGGTYYVVFDTFSNKPNAYLNNILSSYKGDTALYRVDMAKGFNSIYSGETSNKNATKASELVINKETLIKISDGKIVGYFEGTDQISSEL